MEFSTDPVPQVRLLTDGFLYQGSPSNAVHGFVIALVQLGEESEMGNFRGSRGLCSLFIVFRPDADWYGGGLSLRVLASVS